MRRLISKIVATAIVFGISSVASAQYILPSPTARSSNGYDWSGFYVGGKFGYGWAYKGYTSATTLRGAFIPGPPLFDATGVFGGVRVGYNLLPISHVLVGIEWDFSAGDIRGDGPNGSGNLQTLKIDWFTTLRGRAGYAVNNLLIYGTGGAAWAHITDATIRQPGGIVTPAPIGYPDAISPTPLGWTAGGGVEYALTRHWLATFEISTCELNVTA